MALDTIFVNFINYTFSTFTVFLLTAGMFLFYPFLKEKNEKEGNTFAIGFSISILMTLICLLVMMVTPIYAMFKGANMIDFIKVAFDIVSYAKSTASDNDLYLTLIIVLVNFLVIAGVSRIWSNAQIKSKRV